MDSGAETGRGTAVLFGVTILVGAGLLFVVQPLFARMVLPLLGGAPAVWNTALVFYQAVLLLGYLYAHMLSTRLPLRHQVPIHLGVLLLPLIVLPIGISSEWIPSGDAHPVPWLLSLLTATIGLPFFVISTTSPLIQAWFSRSGHRDAADPYLLYAASNLGSMLGLLGYPFLIEPFFTLERQTRLWTAGYVLYLCLMTGCGMVVRRRASLPEPSLPAAGVPPLPWSRRLRWVALAAVPSSLMVSVTTFLTTDLASIPLLWIIPLVLYLGSFILVFARTPPIPHLLTIRALPILLLPLVITLAAGAIGPIGLLFPLHLLVLFVVCMVMHGELARGRPEPVYLTEYYLWMSLGGVIGGMFNALLAPLVFTGVTEYAVTLVLACLLLPSGPAGLRHPGAAGPLPASCGSGPGSRFGVRELAFPIATGLFATIGTIGVAHLEIGGTPGGILLAYAVPALICFGSSRRPLGFGLSVGMFLLTTSLVAGSQVGPHGRLIHAERSFFGVSRVFHDVRRNQHTLYHGSTIHGGQKLDPALRAVPLSYYHPTGPIGKVLGEANRAGDFRSIGVVGLGAGALACYALPGQTWTFYEIDPAVIRIARDERFFTYLHDRAPDARIEAGDARLSLRRAGNRQFDLLVLDAYSSDAIPVHLLTREAVRLYLEKLGDRGLLAFHISNRHLDLEPILAGLASDAGLVALTERQTDIPPHEAAAGKEPSQWVLMARTASDLSRLSPDVWKQLRSEPGTPLWTDDFSSILSALRR
ncbi:MAG TPA: fused MFS/spermidine synthase [Candidatus Ozemobacteraceae bacterium]|nr:fused MFS/spermidine synthase [Candidatus Ozemobacteraceae bacterium]